MQRGNSKHGPARDDELARELEDALRGDHRRAEEWVGAEPAAEDEEGTTGRAEGS